MHDDGDGAFCCLRQGEGRFPLESGLTVLGRDPSCHILIGDEDLSRRHALFFRLGARVWLFDFKSSNGVFVDGRRVDELELRPGAVLRMGRGDFVFEVRLPRPGRGAASREEERALARKRHQRPHLHKKIPSRLERIHGGASPDAIAAAAVESAIEITGADRGVFFLFGGDESRIEVWRSAEGSLLPRAYGTHRCPERVCESVRRWGLPFFSRDLPGDRVVFAQDDGLPGIDVGSACAAPIVAGGTVMGAIYVDVRKASLPLEKVDAATLCEVCLHAAIALDNLQAPSARKGGPWRKPS